jgi:protein O-mannosyl-transferase
MSRPVNVAQKVLVLCLLILGTLGVYWPLLHSGFINIDDHQYVSDNPHVLTGLTWQNVRWAFGNSHASNWHPLTWVSHQLDVQLFGMAPGWHHLTNILFHVANACLLFQWLSLSTGAFWRSAFVAALFALHPLHVESVAWISERKDVLSTFFFLLTLLAYTRYVQNKKGALGTEPSAHRRRLLFYLLALVLFALGLMSKPMLVTLPFVLLLLDYWPFQRWQHLLQHEGPDSAVQEHEKQAPEKVSRRIGSLLVEKIPFFLLSIVSCAVTFKVQSGGYAVRSGVPLDWRVANSITSYAKYLVKTVWPTKLAIFYPYEFFANPWTWVCFLCAGLMVAITAMALVRAKHEPWFAVGWFWFVGTLVPVIGLVQVGSQAMADRYTYIPLIGIFVIFAWFGSKLIQEHLRGSSRASARRAGLALAAIASVAACLVLTNAQVSHWKSNVTLFEHALQVTKRNAVAHFNLGADHALRREFQQAVPHLRAALEADPFHSDSHAALGAILTQQGDIEDALQHYRHAIRTRPWNAVAHNALGTLLLYQGKKPEAIEAYTEAVRLAPDFPNARNNLGSALAAEGKLEDAVAEFKAAIRCDPSSDLAHFGLASVLNQQNKWEPAIQHYYAALQLNPTNISALNNLAWLRATVPESKYRNGPEAVKHAEQACILSNFREPQLIGTLAAAYAEAGRFDDAVESAKKAANLAASLGRDAIATRNKELLELYLSGKPYREQR